jgi:hypothetical protein
MGSASGMLKLINCDACAKYVFNAARLESECCNGCWYFGIQTDMIELQAEQDEEEIICDSCCTFKHKK